MTTFCLKNAKLKVLPKVLVLIIGNTFVGEYWRWNCELPILFAANINIGIGNIFRQYC